LNAGSKGSFVTFGKPARGKKKNHPKKGGRRGVVGQTLVFGAKNVEVRDKPGKYAAKWGDHKK